MTVSLLWTFISDQIIYRGLTQRTKMRSYSLSLVLTTTHYQRCSEREVYVLGVCLLKSLKGHFQNSKQYMVLWPWMLYHQHQGTVIQYYHGRRKCIKGLKAAPWFCIWTSSMTCSGVRGLGYYHNSRKQQYIKLCSVIWRTHRIYKTPVRVCVAMLNDETWAEWRTFYKTDWNKKMRVEVKEG